MDGPSETTRPQGTRPTPKEVRSDASWFSPRSSQSPAAFSPECSICNLPAEGATFLSFVAGLGIGRHAWVAEFRCQEHKPSGGFALIAANLSQWRVYARTAQGIYGVRKLSEEEQNLRALKDHEQRR